MLSVEALKSAYPLTERLDAKNVVLNAVPNTALSALVAATRSDTATIMNAQDGAQSFDLSFISAMCNMTDEITGKNYHDEAIDDITNVAIPAVTSHINFARTIVRPSVDDLVERVQRRIHSMTPSALSGAEVCVDDIPAPITNTAFDTLLAKFSQVSYMEPPLSAALPEQTKEQIISLMKTGSGSIDADVENWLAEGSDWLIELWAGVFQQTPVEGVMSAPTFTSWIEDKECGRDHALAIFLLARKLFDGPLEGTQMDLRRYEALMADYRDQAALRLIREIENNERAKAGGMLVADIYTDGLKVKVNPDVYREWIAGGGVNEVLFANALRSMPFVTVSEINANAEDLLKRWESHCAIVSTVEANHRFSRLKDFFIASFREQVIEDGQKIDNPLSNGEEVIRKFNDEVALTDDHDFKNLYRLALQLVCHARFPNSAAYDILAGVDRIAETNPNLDVQEAAMIAVFEYILCYVGSMIRPVNL